MTLNETNKDSTYPTSGTYTVELSSQPTGTVTVDVTVSGRVNYYMQIQNAANTNPVKRLSFNQESWQTAQTLTVVSAQQNDARDGVTVLTHTASGGGYDSVSAATLTVTVMDTQNSELVFTSDVTEVEESTAGENRPADTKLVFTLRRYDDNTRTTPGVGGIFRCTPKRKGIADPGPASGNTSRPCLSVGGDVNFWGGNQIHLAAGDSEVVRGTGEGGLHIATIDDNFWEGPEVFEMYLEGLGNYILQKPLRIKIIDKDEKPSVRLSLKNGGISEGQANKGFTIKGNLVGKSVIDEELIVELDAAHGLVTSGDIQFTPPPEEWKLTFPPKSKEALLKVKATAPEDNKAEPDSNIQITGTAEKFGEKLTVTPAGYYVSGSDRWDWKFRITDEDRTVRSGRTTTFTVEAQVWQKTTENQMFPKEGLKLVLKPCKAGTGVVLLCMGGLPADWVFNPAKLEFTWNEDEKGQPCHSNSRGEGCVKTLSWTVTSPVLEELQGVTFNVGGGLKKEGNALSNDEQRHQKTPKIERKVEFTAGGKLKVTRDLYVDTTASTPRRNNRYWLQDHKINFVAELNQEVQLSPGTKLRITLDSGPVDAPCKINKITPLKVVCTHTVQEGEYDYDGKFKVAAGALDFRGAMLTAADDPQTSWPAPTVPAQAEELGEGKGELTSTGTQIYGGRHAFQATATVQEGFREGAGEQTLEVIITDFAQIPAGQDIDIPITIENGTTTDQDWTLIQGGNVIIKKGKTEGTGTAKISARLDAINDEGDETLFVGGSGRVVRPATLALKDSPPIKLSASPDRIREPPPGTTPENAPWVDVTLKAEIDPAAQVFEAERTVVVLLRCDDRPDPLPCARSGSDFRWDRDNTLATALLINIPKNQRSGEIVRRFQVLPDRLVEGDEVLRLEGRGPFLNVGSAFITIEDASGSMPGVILSASPTTVREGGGAQNVSVTARLDGSALGNDVIVTLDVSGEAAAEKREVVEGSTTITTEKDYDPAWTPTSKQITIPADQKQGSTTVTLGVTPVDDAEVEGDESITVEAKAELQNADKDPLTVQPVDVTLQDNETRGVTVEPTALSIEGGLSKTYRVKLNSKPAHQAGETVRIDAKAPPAALLTVTPGALDFTEDSWKSFQTFTVTAHELAEAATVSIANDVGGGDYRLVTADPVAVTLIEAPEVTLALDQNSIAENGGVATVTASLNPASQVAVTVEVKAAAVAPGVATDFTLSNNKNLVIAAGQTDSTGTVTITAVNNAVDADDKTVTVSGVVTGHAGIRAPLPQTLTIPDDDDPPSLTVAAGSAAVVTEGAAATFTVARSQASGNAFTVEWTTEADTADGAVSADTADYTAVTTARTITFAAGDTRKTITVQTTDDMLDEPDSETFVVRLANPTGRAEIATETATGTITDNDATPSFKVDDGSAAEGEAVEFVVTREGAVDNVVSVQWTTAEHTGQDVIAAAATDYTAVTTARTISFAKRVMTQTVSVPTTEDTIDEPDETFQVVLSREAKAAGDPGATPTLTDDTAVGTITDDDDTPKVSLTLTPSAIDESGTTNTSTVTASMDRTSSESVLLTVSAAPTPGSNTAAGDYTLSENKMLTIAAGETASTGTVTVTAEDNEVDAADKSVTVSATASGGLGLTAPDSETLTITDDDTHGVTVSPPALELEEVDNDGTDGTKENEGTYTVVLDSRPTAAVTVSVTSGAPGVATAAPASLTFAPGAWNVAQTVTVTAVDDAVDNTMNKRATEVTHAVTSSDSQYQGEEAEKVSVSVDDDDGPPDGITLMANPDSLDEDAGATVVTVTAAVSGGTAYADEKAVVVSVVDDTAVSPADYAAVTGFTITIEAGSTSETGTFTLTPVDDKLDEDNEKLKVTGSLSGVTVTGDEITITDTDATPSFKVEDNSAAEGEAVTFVVTREGAEDNVVSVQWATAASSGDKAASSTDYTAESTAQTLNFAKGVTTQTVSVPTTEDTIDEPDETFQVVLSGPAKADGDPGATPTLADEDKTAIGTIEDDDDAPDGIILTVDTDGSTDGDQDEVSEDAGATPVTVTATVDGTTRYAADKAVVVSVVEGTATEPEDYAAVSAFTITIGAGEESATGTFTLTPEDDKLDEPVEAIGVTGTSAGLTITGAEITITDNDATPSFKVGNGRATEGEAVEFVVTREGAVDNVVSVQWTTAADSGEDVAAASSTDYTAVSTPETISFAKRVTAQTVSVSTTEDIIAEGDETFQVVLSNPAKAADDPGATPTLADEDKTAIGTIEDDDDAPDGITLAADLEEWGEGAGEKAVTVTATVNGETRYAAATEVVVSVDGNTATATTDYIAVEDFTITIGPGEESATGTFTLTPVADDLDEENETIDVTGTSGDLTVDGTSVTITDDDTHGVTVSETMLVLKEADDGDTEATENAGTYTVVLDSQPTAAVTVAVSSGAPTVATAAPASLTFAPGDWNAAQTVTVTAVADTIDNLEDERTTDVTHAVTSSDTQYQGEEAKKVSVTVGDDDDAPSGITLSASPATVGEGAGATTVTVTATVNGETRYAEDKAVEVSVAEGTATEPEDYAAVSAFTITIGAGEESATGTFTLTPTDDTLDEPNETLEVTGSLSGVTVTGAEITITNDDERPSFAVADASATEGGNVAFVITRTGAVDNVVSVQWKTAASSGASAAASTDYTAVSTAETISFGKSVTKQTVEVATTEDTIDEGDETFEVKLSMPAKAADDPGRVPALGADTAVGTIEDNDSAPKGITLTTDTESLSEAAGETTVTVTATVTGGTAYADDKAVVGERVGRHGDGDDRL